MEKVDSKSFPKWIWTKKKKSKNHQGKSSDLFKRVIWRIHQSGKKSFKVFFEKKQQNWKKANFQIYKWQWLSIKAWIEFWILKFEIWILKLQKKKKEKSLQLNSIIIWILPKSFKKNIKNHRIEWQFWKKNLTDFRKASLNYACCTYIWREREREYSFAAHMVDSIFIIIITLPNSQIRYLNLWLIFFSFHFRIRLTKQANSKCRKTFPHFFPFKFYFKKNSQLRHLFVKKVVLDCFFWRKMSCNHW